LIIDVSLFGDPLGLGIFNSILFINKYFSSDPRRFC